VIQANQGINLRYLCYVLAETDISGYLSGSTQPKLTQAAMNAIDVRLPEQSYQNSVVSILRALDDKIDLNREITRAIDALAMATYESALSSDSRSTAIGAIAAFHNRGRVPLSSRQRTIFRGPYPYFGANGVIDHVAEYRFDGSFVLVGEDGTVETAQGAPVAQYVDGQFWVSNHAHVLTGTAVSNELLLVALRAADVHPYVTGAVQPKLSMGNLKRLQVELPGPTSQSAVEQRLRTYFWRIRAAERESRILADLKNVLLPGLISGEIRVREAEKVVEAT
jgi:type I restriction enzyme S subunit